MDINGVQCVCNDSSAMDGLGNTEQMASSPAVSMCHSVASCPRMT